METKPVIFTELLVRCKVQPNPNTENIEGFDYDTFYRAVKVEAIKTFYRLYPDKESDYYETCSEKKFNRYFENVMAISETGRACDIESGIVSDSCDAF